MPEMLRGYEHQNKKKERKKYHTKIRRHNNRNPGRGNNHKFYLSVKLLMY